MEVKFNLKESLKEFKSLLVRLISWSAIVRDWKKCNREVRNEWLQIVKVERCKEVLILSEVKIGAHKEDRLLSRIVMTQEVDLGLNNAMFLEIENQWEVQRYIKDRRRESLLDKMNLGKIRTRKIEEQEILRINMSVSNPQLNRSPNFRIKLKWVQSLQFLRKWMNIKLRQPKKQK